MSGYGLGIDQLSANSQHAIQTLLFRRLMGGVATAKLVQVISCTNDGALAAVGTVNVQPLVTMLDGAGNAIPHGQLYALPYFRMQGGVNAIIMDPAAGDLGLAVFLDRDSSSVKRTKAQANPGSRRRFSMADGMYIGGFLNGIPNQLVAFSNTGILVKSPTAIAFESPSLTHNGVDIGYLHEHGGVTPGASNTGPPDQ